MALLRPRLGGSRQRKLGELLADLPEVPHQLRRRRVSLVGVLREAPLDRPAKRLRDAGVEALERERLVLDDRRQRLDGRRAVEEAAMQPLSRVGRLLESGRICLARQDSGRHAEAESLLREIDANFHADALPPDLSACRQGLAALVMTPV